MSEDLYWERNPWGWLIQEVNVGGIRGAEEYTLQPLEGMFSAFYRHHIFSTSATLLLLLLQRLHLLTK